MQLNRMLQNDIQGIAVSPTIVQKPESRDSSAPVRIFNRNGRSRIVLVCEHASNYIPKIYKGLGLSEAEKASHVAWDIGARGLAEALSTYLDAVLITGEISRLVYDCNRPPSAPDAMPAKSEMISVPGNKDLTKEAREDRVKAVYEPFRQTLAATLESRPETSVLITLHSFTPVYFSKFREVEIGVIHHEDDSLAKAIVRVGSAASRFKFALNEPYSRADGVAHSLEEHATPNGLINAMIEVRNDLIQTPETQKEVAEMLAGIFETSLSDLQNDRDAEVRP